mgnify:CR=1 FL=1
MDLSKIDFEAPRSRFRESKHKNTDLDVLKGEGDIAGLQEIKEQVEAVLDLLCRGSVERITFPFKGALPSTITPVFPSCSLVSPSSGIQPVQYVRGTSNSLLFVPLPLPDHSE